MHKRAEEKQNNREQKRKEDEPGLRHKWAEEKQEEREQARKEDEPGLRHKWAEEKQKTREKKQMESNLRINAHRRACKYGRIF